VLWTVGFGLLTTGYAARLVVEHRLLARPELFWPEHHGDGDTVAEAAGAR
jgi:hypothetical protein